MDNSLCYNSPELKNIELQSMDILQCLLSLVVLFFVVMVYVYKHALVIYITSEYTS